MPRGTPDPNKLHPLSDYAWNALGRIVQGGAEGSTVQEINAGTVDRLLREELIEESSGTRRRTFVATEAGRRRWQEKDKENG